MKLRKEVDFEFLKYRFKKKWEDIKTSLYVIWFFGTAALMITFASNEIYEWSSFIYAHYFAVFGYLAFKTFGAFKNIKRTWPSFLSMTIGLIVMLVCVLLYFEII